MLALIKSFRYLPGEHSVYRADEDQYNRVEEGDHVGRVHVGVADQHVIFPRGVVEHCLRWCHYHPHYYYQHLEGRLRISCYGNIGCCRDKMENVYLVLLHGTSWPQSRPMESKG